MSHFGIFLTYPPSPSLKTKGRGVNPYKLCFYTLPSLFKGRAGEGLSGAKEYTEIIHIK
jgi:hypothetical protein